MKILFREMIPAVLTATLTGCFSLGETPYPQTVMSRPAISNATVSVRGFEAHVPESVLVNGLSTVYVDDWRGGPWWGGPGYWETVPVCATVTRMRETSVFRERAESRLEEAGWAVKAQVPDYLVEVRFSGPTEEPGAFWWRALRVVGTLFLSDRAVLACHAKLKVYDNRSGRLLYARDYDEMLEESMWSPVPVLGPLSYEKTTCDWMIQRCLCALTDRASADASAFLSGGLGAMHNQGDENTRM